MTSKRSLLFYCIVAMSAAVGSSFHVSSIPHAILGSSKHCSSKTTRLYSDTRGKNGKTKFGQKTDGDVSRFLTDFRTADGNVVDPYKMLRVSRRATQTEIKQSYRRLSRKLHPDMVAQKEILPGRCSNLEEVREEWERMKFSYEILSDPLKRKKYDRNSSAAEVLEDPAAAMGRAVAGGEVG